MERLSNTLDRLWPESFLHKSSAITFEVNYNLVTICNIRPMLEGLETVEILRPPNYNKEYGQNFDSCQILSSYLLIYSDIINWRTSRVRKPEICYVSLVRTKNLSAREPNSYVLFTVKHFKVSSIYVLRNELLNISTVALQRETHRFYDKKWQKEEVV